MTTTETNLAAFAQLQLKPVSWLKLTGGTRFDQFFYGIDNRLNPAMADSPLSCGRASESSVYEALTPSEAEARIERTLQMEAAVHLRRLQSGLPILATVGSTAPFIGLLARYGGS